MENQFRTEEIDVKETWLRSILVFQLRDPKVLPVHLSSPFSEYPALQGQSKDPLVL